MQRLKYEINGLQLKEEKMWKQRSRALQPHEGDSNTSFFHSRSSNRFKRNKIDILEDAQGNRCSNEEEISQILIDSYQSLFTSSPPSQVEQVMEAILEMVTEEINQSLSACLTREEVEVALKQMEPLKSPGPNGLPPLFSRNFGITLEMLSLQLYFIALIQVIFLHQ